MITLDNLTIFLLGVFSVIAIAIIINIYCSNFIYTIISQNHIYVING